MHVYVCVRWVHVHTQVTENNSIKKGVFAFFVMKLKIIFFM